MKSLLKKTVLMLAPLWWMAGNAIAQPNYSLRSPDTRIEVKIRTGDRVRYDVLLNAKPLLEDSTLSIKIDQKTLGLDPRVKTVMERAQDRMLEPPVRQKSAKIRENYNELRLEM